MKNILIAIFAIISTLLIADEKQGLVAYWEFNEGTGSSKVRDLSGNGNDGKISNPETCKWAREDDRGFFLNFTGGINSYVKINDAEALNLKSGLTILIRFSCDLTAIGKTGFASLLSKGNSYDEGYSIMIGKDGSVLINLKGMSPAYINFKGVMIQSNMEHLLCVVYDGKRINVFLDGKERGTIKTKGRLLKNNAPLYIGSIKNSYPFTGNVYTIKIYNKALSPSVASDGNKEIVSSREKHTRKTIIFTDFTKLKPESALISGRFERYKWILREGAHFMAESDKVLYPPEGYTTPDIICSPDLNGVYDLYIGMRAVKGKTSIQVKTASMKDYYTVTLPDAGNEKHENLEVLWARNVKMDGEDVILHPTGFRAYIGHLKFVPVKPKRLQALVKKEKKRTEEDYNNEFKTQTSLKERHFMDNSKLPELTQASRKHGFVVFPVNPLKLLFPNSIPEKDIEPLELSMNVAKGEIKSTALGIRPLKEIKNFSVELDGALKGPQGEIPAKNISVGLVEFLSKRTTNYEGAGEFMYAPQYIERKIASTLSPAETRELWFKLETPMDIKSGEYRGNIVMHANDDKRIIPLKVNVYSFALEQIRDLNIGMYTDSSHQGYFDIKGELADMKKHGMTSVFLFGNTKYLEISGDSPDALKVDFSKSILSKILEEFKRLKFPGELFLQTESIRAFCEKFNNDEAFETAYISIIKEIDKYCKENQNPQIIFQAMDELPSHPRQFPAFIEEMKCLKKAGAKTEHNHMWYKTCRPLQNEIDKSMEYVDIITLRYNNRNLWYVDSWEDILRKGRELGKDIYAYNSNNGCVFAQPEAMRFLGGWFFRTVGKGCKGHFTFVYQWASGNCYNDLDGIYTDWFYHYPPSGKRGGGPSLDWESYRDGINDLRYIYTLESMIRRCKERGFVKEAQRAEELMKNLTDSFDISRMKKECVFFEQKWDETGALPDGTLFAEGNYYLPNGWQKEDYDAARNKIASKIIDLRNILGIKELAE